MSIYNAMRVAQGEVAGAVGLPPEAISPAKLFPKLAAASHCHALFQVVVPGRPARKPRTGRRRKRRFCTARKHWKVAKKLCFCRMLKNGQMQGSRNREE
jgi:hypothetical protein